MTLTDKSGQICLQSSCKAAPHVDALSLSIWIVVSISLCLSANKIGLLISKRKGCFMTSLKSKTVVFFLTY